MPVLVDADRSQLLEDRFQGVRRQGERDDGGELAVARLVGEDVVDALVVEDPEHRLALAPRNRDLDEPHVSRCDARRQKPVGWSAVN